MELGVPQNLIYIEQFGTTDKNAETEIKAVDNAQLTAQLNGKTHQITIPKGQTILQALKNANAEPPYSCEGGVCATCIAKVTQGKAEMKVCMALDDNEIANGMVLTCQALPITESVSIVFED